MPDNNFREKLINQIKEKQKDKKALEQQRFEILSNIRTLDDELKQLETALSVHDSLMGITTSHSSTANYNGKYFKKLTTAESCVMIMKEMSGHARVRDLMERLTKAGRLTSNYKNSYSTVLKALQRDGRFEQIGRGEFALKEAIT